MQIRINQITDKAVGLGYLGDKAVFIPNTLPGELIEFNSLVEGRTSYSVDQYHIVEESPLRIKPKCKYSSICGGCDFDYVDNYNSAKLKFDIVAHNFKRKLNIDIEEDFSYSEVENYRARCRVHVSLKDNKIGFLTKRANSLVEIDSCPCLEDRLNELLKNPQLILKKARSALFEKGINRKTGFVELSLFNADDKVLLEKEEGKRTVAGIPFSIKASSFFQSNPHVLSSLFDYVVENVKGENVMDLYAGAAVFSSLLKDKNMIAVERDKNCLALAKKNAPHASFYTDDVYKWAKNRKVNIDTIIVDPPRVGLDRQVPALISSWNAKDIIYVSCNSATLVRDLAHFDKYEVKKVKVFDFYPGTSHVECVAVLSRKESL